MITIKPGDILNFKYNNWRGVSSWRRVVARALEYRTTPYHEKAQWYLRAYCLERESERTFALVDIEIDMLTKV